MSPRRRSSTLTASPVLIGAVTVLVAIVAVFLSYNANSGLPFVPTYDLKANVPNAAQLVKGFEVRIGGARVGIVSRITPKRRPDGSTYAQLTLKLDKTVEPLPKDTTMLVRPRSTLGLKYLQLAPGQGPRRPQAGATIPVRQATPARRRAGRVPEHVRRARPARLAGATCKGFGDGLAGTRTGPQHGGAGVRAAAGGPRAGGAQPRLARDAARPLLPLAAARRERGRPGRRDAGGAVRQPRHHLHRARERRAAVPAGDDHRGRGSARRSRSATSRASGRSCATAPRSSASSRPARPRCRARRRCSRTPSSPAPRCCPRRRAVQRGDGRPVRVAARTSPTTRSPSRASRS